jgi:hypothetical protein
LRSRKYTVDQSLGYCIDETEPYAVKDKLSAVLLYTAILKTGFGHGISLDRNEPFCEDLILDLERAYEGIDPAGLLALGLQHAELERVTKDMAFVKGRMDEIR